MKQNSTKILVALIAIIILAGAFMIGIKGLEFELSKQSAKKIEVGLGKQFKESFWKTTSDNRANRSI